MNHHGIIINGLVDQYFSIQNEKPHTNPFEFIAEHTTAIGKVLCIPPDTRVMLAKTAIFIIKEHFR